MILIPYFNIQGTSSYPDDYKLFSDLNKVTFNNNEYWVVNYTGSLSLEKEPTYQDYLSWKENNPTPSGIRVITKRAFWDRVGEVSYAELIGLSKTDNLLAARLSIINGAEYINLDEASLQSAFSELKEAGLFTEEDQTRIFSDAEDYEIPEKTTYNI